MQKRNPKFTMVTISDLLFRPPSDHASFRIKENPYNRLYIKEEISFPLHSPVCIYL